MLIPFQLPGMAATLECETDILAAFTGVLGLCIHPSKSAFVYKGELTTSAFDVIRATAFPQHRSVKYLGIMLGHLTAAKAFVPTLGKAFCRAKLASYLDPSLKEKYTLLKPWILLVLLLTA